MVKVTARMSSRILIRAATVLNDKKLTTTVNRDVVFGLESENMAARELKYLIFTICNYSLNFSNCRISSLPVEED